MTHLERRVLVLLLVALGACSKGSKSSGAAALGSVDDAELATLAPEAQYAVANNLLSTLYSGVAAKDFFDLSKGLATPTVAGGADLVARTRTALSTPLADRDARVAAVDVKYDFDAEVKPTQVPLAILHELPLSRDSFDLWMAYTLASSILFSPAAELDTVDLTDVQKVMYRLDRLIRQDQPIRQIVYEHMISQENWRRFRSPEDNTREMMEIFLGRFRDDEVPKAAKACRNWHLSDESQGYQLVIGYDENAEPQDILDGTVTDCFEFYRKVSQHETLIPTIALTMVKRFFPLATDQEKADLAAALAGANPTTFRELFTSLVFSRQNLLGATRALSHEELLMGLAQRLPWIASRSFFLYLNRPPTWWSGLETSSQMKQAPFSYKLGRREIPLDSLSFAYVHKAARERVLIDRKTSTDDSDGGWLPDLYTGVALSGDDYLHYLFLSGVMRKATDTELAALKAVITARGYADEARKREKAMIVLDYLSRLPELYVHRAH